MNKELKKIIILESTSSGAGFDVIKSALKMSYQVYFLIQDKKRYELKKLKEIDRLGVKLIKVDTSNVNQCIQVIDQYIIKPDAVVCINDYKIIEASKIAAHYDLPFIPTNAALVCRYKDRTVSFCKKNDILSFSTRIISSRSDLLRSQYKYPIVLKASLGSGSCEVVYVEKEKDLEKSYDHILKKIKSDSTKIMMQPFIKGDLVSSEVLVSKGEINHLGITDRIMGPLPYFAEVSYSFPAQISLSNLKKIESINRKIITNLNIKNGALHIEYILSEKGPVLVEINPRLAGAMQGRMISESLGVDIYEQVIRISLGENIQIPKQFKKATSTHTFYADKRGFFKKIKGLDVIKKMKGYSQYIERAKIGSYVDTPKDFKGVVGQLITNGKDVDESWKNNLNMQKLVSIDVDVNKGVQ